MSDYSQPSFLKFGHDSLDLVKRVLSEISQAQHLLDLGAGCGVIGIELANKLNSETLTLLELQSDYLPFLQVNLKEQLHVSCETRIEISSFGEWHTDQKFDLIVSNPPYYLSGHGRPSPDDRRQKARSFEVDGHAVFLNLIEKGLSTNGRAYIVIKAEDLILKEMQKHLPASLVMEHEQHQEVYFLKLSRLNKD